MTSTNQPPDWADEQVDKMGWICSCTADPCPRRQAAAAALRAADQRGYRRGMQEREAQLISKLEAVRSDGSSLIAQLIQAEQEGYERGIEEERQRAMDLADGMIDSLSGMSRSAARQEVVRELKRRIETWAAVEFDGVAPGCALLPAETEEQQC